VLSKGRVSFVQVHRHKASLLLVMFFFLLGPHGIHTTHDELPESI
jgi:hypothetical protein